MKPITSPFATLMICSGIIKSFITFSLLLTLVSCKEYSQEFIPLNHMTFVNSYYKNQLKISYYVLITNPADDLEKLKNTITQFVEDSLHNNQFMKEADVKSLNFVFYKKTGNTSYFIKHNEEHGALYNEEISHYKEDYIANYLVEKCDKGYTKTLFLFDRPERIVYSNCK